jgi:ketosteroid isomerase-like protein
LGAATDLSASSEEDAKTVAALDTKYQAAVKANDPATMDQILADNFILVTGRGKVFSKTDLIESTRKKEVTYEHQDEKSGTQKVRVWGDTAVVTALLWIKAVQGGKPIDYKLWFSDTYVRTPAGLALRVRPSFSAIASSGIQVSRVNVRSTRGCDRSLAIRTFPFLTEISDSGAKELPRKILQKKLACDLVL